MSKKETDYFLYKQNKVMFYMDSIITNKRLFPPSLQISLTDYCAEKCYMCDHWKRENRVHVSLELLIAFLDKAKEHGLETVCYSGGDPLMYKHVNEVMQWHIDNDVEFGFITTGSVPIKRLNIESLRAATFVRCSLDAIDADVYHQIRGVKAVGHAMETIKFMKDEGVKIGLGITLSKLNVSQITKLVDFTILNKIEEFRVWVIRHPTDGINDIDKALKSSAINQIKNATKALKEVKVDHNLDETLNILKSGEKRDDFSTCKAALYQLFVDPSGNVFPCCIIAGDTEAEFQGEALFTMQSFVDLHIRETYKAIRAWSDKQVDDFCLTNCTKRLSTINVTVEQQQNKKYFF